MFFRRSQFAAVGRKTRRIAFDGRGRVRNSLLPLEKKNDALPLLPETPGTSGTSYDDDDNPQNLPGSASYSNELSRSPRYPNGFPPELSSDADEKLFKKKFPRGRPTPLLSAS
ncbi:hypothetical protein RUM43_005628 [Polyplax serrata]|uniref:Uncharacterized protein n=1 Tax=Polyplax serrata TaxID=468196 RepID=A0AAN8RUT8_POLSC